MTAKRAVNIRQQAMDLLARREHSVQELRFKLKSRHYDDEAIEKTLTDLQKERWLSDQRFTETFVHRRFNAGVGPCKIRFELRQKGIPEDLADETIEPMAARWEESMLQLRVRKYGDNLPTDFNERLKQARFLQNRGFSPESVMRLFR